jgi:membrane-associated phospholipid phosphatase
MDVESGLPPRQDPSFWSRFGPQLTLLIFFVIYGVLASLSSVRNDVFFLERDPSLSYPLSVNQVSNAWLIVISTIVPIVIISTISFIIYSNNKLTRTFWLCYGVLLSTFVTMSIYNTIKIITGRLRPDFFAQCNYKGYADALKSNNFTQYLLLTSPDVVSNINDGWTSSDDGRKSFPSGHSGLSFAGLSFLSLFLLFGKILGTDEYVSWIGLVCCSPYYLASWVAITRIQDYKHHVDDVLAGAIIGIAVSWHVFKSIKALAFPK